MILTNLIKTLQIFIAALVNHSFTWGLFFHTVLNFQINKTKFNNLF